MSRDDDLSRSQRKARKELLDAASRALQNEDTRYLMRWVLELTGLFDPTSDQHQRAVGLGIVALLNEVDPYEFVRLMKEGADEVVRKRNEANEERA